MQFGGQQQRPLGVIYCTTMSRPDSALALAMLNIFANKREARLGGVAVVGSSLASAMFADAVTRFYQVSGQPPNSNTLLPVGWAVAKDGITDPPMVKVALDRKGTDAYARNVRGVTDTSEVAAMLRNAITAQSEKNSVLVLSAPATELARCLALPGVRELAAFRVKALVVVDSGVPQDAVALRDVLAKWPNQVVFCGRELGESLPFPASAVEKELMWAPANPVADAYRAYRAMPYDAAGWDLAAMLYAVHPELFQLTAGNVQVDESGGMRFVEAADGKHRGLSVEAAKKQAVLDAFVAYATAKPVARVFPSRQVQQQPAPKVVEPKKPEAAPSKKEAP